MVDGEYAEKPSSRLNQRTLGLTNRIWIILSLFGFIIFFTRAIFPPDKSPTAPRHTFLNANLKPKNYLNASAEEANPFDFCPVFGPGDEYGAKYGVHALTKSRLHLGSGARVQRVIHKALSGLPVTISVLGGSGECRCSSWNETPVMFSSKQCLRAMEQGMTLYHQSAIPRGFSNGGIRIFPIRLPS